MPLRSPADVHHWRANRSGQRGWSSARPPRGTGNPARASWVGIGLAAADTVVIPLFGRINKRLGRQLRSQATTSGGKQNILCAYLSLAVLTGLAANALAGLWWAGPW